MIAINQARKGEREIREPKDFHTYLREMHGIA
jgi:hypothetical protein